MRIRFAVLEGADVQFQRESPTNVRLRFSRRTRVGLLSGPPLRKSVSPLAFSPLRKRANDCWRPPIPPPPPPPPPRTYFESTIRRDAACRWGEGSPSQMRSGALTQRIEKRNTGERTSRAATWAELQNAFRSVRNKRKSHIPIGPRPDSVDRTSNRTPICPGWAPFRSSSAHRRLPRSNTDGPKNAGGRVCWPVGMWDGGSEIPTQRGGCRPLILCCGVGRRFHQRP